MARAAVLVVLFLFASASADAAVVSYRDGVVTVAAAPGEANRVHIERDGFGVSILDGGVLPTAGTGCGKGRPDADSVGCDIAENLALVIRLRLADGDDLAEVGSINARPNTRIEFGCGAGRDRIEIKGDYTQVERDCESVLAGAFVTVTRIAFDAGGVTMTLAAFRPLSALRIDVQQAPAGRLLGSTRIRSLNGSRRVRIRTGRMRRGARVVLVFRRPAGPGASFGVSDVAVAA